MRRFFFIFLASIYCVKLLAQPSISIEAYKSGFVKPVNIKHAGDDRLFVVEQDGRIVILNADSSVNTVPFLDITDRVGTVGNIGDERGLLGLAFHPDYANKGFFYVNYINDDGDTVISRFSVNTTDPDRANAASEMVMIEISQPFSNHNGGDLAFGSDGYLYISSGDGGSGGDPGDRAQNLLTMLGKMLRIDVNGMENGKNYSIPDGNPYKNDPQGLDEIWAYGLRNAWRFSFDRLNNDLWIADVGQGSFEEINKMPLTTADINYGWRCYEANQSFNSTNCPNDNLLTFPIASYAHSGSSRCSITGGYRYRGTENPGLTGLYFFADYCSNEIGILEASGINWNMSFTQAYPGNNWVAFGEDIQGELYIAGISSGTIYKIVDNGLGVDDEGSTEFKIYPNPAELSLKITVNNAITLDKIRIYDLRGKLIRSVSDIASNFYTLATHNIAKGMYFVAIYDSDGNKAVKKLILK